MFLKESALIQEKVSWIKLYRYCQKYLHPMVKDYEEHGTIGFKEYDLLCVYYLPNT